MNKNLNNTANLVDPRVRYDLQGLTFDCEYCGVNNKQYHAKQKYCCEPKTCMWDHKGIEHGPRECTDCGCVDDVPLSGRGYRCRVCREFRLNPDRTDLKRRSTP